MNIVDDVLPRERLDRIQSRLARDGRVAAADLAREFRTSEDTIRRDLRDLAAAGLCRRVYGGALSVSPAALPISRRINQRPDAKLALARAAVTLVEAGQTIFIDTGSTNRAIASALPDDVDITVVTNAPMVAIAAAAHARCTLIMIGGRVDAVTGGSFGARALCDLEGIRPDLCFVGTCAASAEHGLAVFDSEEAIFKHRLVEMSSRAAAAVTREKLEAVAPFGFGGLGVLDTLVLEAGSAIKGHERFPGLRLLHASALETRP